MGTFGFGFNVALTFVKSPSLMCFCRRLFRTWPLLGSHSLMCFVFVALELRDRIQIIPFKIIPKASRAPSTVGTFFRTSNSCFFLEALLLGGGPRIKSVQH